VLLKHFGAEGTIQIDVNKRGFPPLGGGEVWVKLAFVK